jgi:predicted DNA-binding transcriptional regulator AlpA
MKDAILTPRLLTAKQAGAYLGFKSAWPIRELAWKGELPIVQLGKRRIGFDVRDLDEFIESRKTRET